MNTERRFGIIIGINDYTIKPLDFCVNDAESIADILEKKCNFSKNDIYIITSSKENTTKDVTGKFNNNLKEIEKDFIQNTDSIFFFFAGHGKYAFENSCLQFHDSFMEILTIFENVNRLLPKYQCYVIDACESGGKVLTRSSKNNDILSKFVSQSNGIMFMYAATENESANEKSEHKHGLFTKLFLDAIMNEGLYDTDGILTPNRIQDYVAKETLKESGFKQTPVIENRTIGYYPFAFNYNAIEKKETEKVLNFDLSKSSNVINNEYFPHVPSEVREDLFKALKPLFLNELKSWCENINLIDYEVFIEDNFKAFQYDVQSSVKDDVIKKSISEKVISIDNIFISERVEAKPSPNSIFSGFGMIDALIKKSEREYIFKNYINWNETGIISKSILLKARSIHKVSVGITFIAYQSLYGIGLTRSQFYLDYNGYSNDNLQGLDTKIIPFKYHANTIENIIESIKLSLIKFDEMIVRWNNQRESEIDDFDKRAI